jgi:hypothetical protein
MHHGQGGYGGFSLLKQHDVVRVGNQLHRASHASESPGKVVIGQLFKVEMKLLGFDDMQLSDLCACFGFQGQYLGAQCRASSVHFLIAENPVRPVR